VLKTNKAPMALYLLTGYFS